jgi:competence protein ComEC
MLGAEPERRKSLPARLAMGLRSILEAERSRWFLGAPVILACGIAAYFILPVEPPVWAVAILGLIAAFGLVILARGHGGLGVALISIFLAGIVVAKVRVEISGPQNMVVSAGYVQVSGWLERAGARSGGGTRKILKPTTIDGLGAGDLPQRVRLIWRGKGKPLPAGSFVVVKARFMPRRLPVWPGGYDAGFFAWFDGIGAQGFTFAAPQKTSHPDDARVPWRLRLSAGIENVRKTITKRVLAPLPA